MFDVLYYFPLERIGCRLLSKSSLFLRNVCVCCVHKKTLITLCTRCVLSKIKNKYLVSPAIFNVKRSWILRNFSCLNIASRNWKQVRVAIDEGSNKLSTTSINNYKTSENNAIRTTEAPNNNYVINNLAASTRKEKFRTNTASFKLGST